MIDSLGAGGAERSTAALLPSLMDRGFDVAVVTLYRASEGSEDEVRATGFDVRTLTSTRFLGQVRELRSIIRSERPDVIHTALWAADQVGRLAAIGTPTRVVSSLVNVPRSLRAPDVGVPQWKSRTADMFDFLTARFAAAKLHAVTHGVAAATSRAHPSLARKIQVVERGRDRGDLGMRSAERRAAVRRALGIDAETEVVIAVGRQEHQKAHVDLIRAISVLRERRPRLWLLIVGRAGSATREIEQLLVAEPDVADNVQLLGHRNDVADLLVAGDVMALPSRFEGAAGAVLEAMALETPIVSTRLPGLEGVLVDGRNALLVDTGDVENLARAIERILGDPSLGRLLAGAALDTFEQRFTIERSADAMVDLYRDLVG